MTKELLPTMDNTPASQADEKNKENFTFFSGDSIGVEYKIGKNKLHRISCSDKKDVVFGRYKINLQKPLPQFDTSMAKAYSVTDIEKNDSESFYTVILDNRYPPRLAEINILLNKELENFTNVVAAQVLPLSTNTGRSFAIILQKPRGIKFSEFLTSNGPVNEDALISKIIKPIFHIISFFEKKNITHGKINLDNIYIDTDGYVTLGECVSEVCGASQPIIYEDISRSSTAPIAKGRGKSSSVDFHALGVVTVFCLRGKNPFENVSDKDIINLKYLKNTYRIITDGMDISLYMLDFIRGTVTDHINKVWGNERVKEWINGRRYNLLPPTENIDSGRPILFNGKKFVSKKHLAYSMFENWDEAKNFIEDSTLIRWIERSVQDSILAEKMEVLTKRRGGGEQGSSFEKDDELLSQYIMLLDPQGPIRIKQLSANIDGVGTLLADAYATSNKEHLEAAKNIIQYSLASYIEMESDSNDGISSIKEAAFALQRCSELFRKKYLGFGLERSLYELNPTMPCQANILNDDYTCVIPDMLLSLEKHKALKKEIFDVHLTSFLYAKLELPTRIRVKSLSKFPDFASHPSIQNLSLISVAQQSCNENKLPNLSKYMAETLDKYIETFHNRFIRENLRKELEKVVNTGNLTKIPEVISNTKYLLNDTLGFRRAVLAYKNNTIQIMKLSNKKAVGNMGYLYGLQLSVILTFFIATIVVIVLILKTI